MATARSVVTGYALPGAGESLSTFAVVVPAGTTKLVVLAGNIRYNPPRTITGITFNGVALTNSGLVQANAATPPSYTRIEAWYLDSPAIATANVVVTWDGAARGSVVAFGLSDAASGAFTATAGQATSAALAVASTSGGLVLSGYLIDDGDATTIALTAGTSEFNGVGSTGAGTASRFGVASQAGTGGSVSTTWTPTGAGSQPSHIVMAIGSAVASSAITGTLATGTKTQSDIVTGGTTIIRTLSGETFVASFTAIQAALTAGISAASSPATGWNALVRDAAVNPITWVRTSATIATGTLAAVAGYAISADEVLTDIIPASALTLAVAITSTPTITVNEGAVLSAMTGTTNASGVLTVDLTSDQPNVRVLIRAYIGGVEVHRTTTLPTAARFAESGASRLAESGARRLAEST